VGGKADPAHPRMALSKSPLETQPGAGATPARVAVGLGYGGWPPDSAGVRGSAGAGPAPTPPTASTVHQVSPGSFYNWRPARGLQPFHGCLERRKPATRAAGRARRHIQHQPSEESSSTRVLKGFSVRCH